MTRRPLVTSPPGAPRRHRRAQVLVEFALVLPLLILLFGVLVDLGGLLLHHVAVQTALREGVRAAVEFGAGDDAIRSVIARSTSVVAIRPDEVRIERSPLTPVEDPGPAPTALSISVESRHTFVIPFVVNGQTSTTVLGTVHAVVPGESR